MIRFFSHFAVLFLVVGCSPEVGQLEQTDPSRIRLQALAMQYSRFLNVHGGKLPASEADLKKFITKSGKSFLAERGIATVDELFVSPRDSEPLVVSYGTHKLVRGFSADPIVAHEQTGIDGKRLVAFPSGAVVELDPEMFAKLPLAEDTEPKQVEDSEIPTKK